MKYGFEIIPDVLAADDRQKLIEALGPVSGAGRRSLLSNPIVAELSRSTRIRNLLKRHLVGEPFPVRTIYFDKSADANWLVPWHQDLTVAVRARLDVPRFGPWSVKDGFHHAHAPTELLQQMITVRIHLDEADETNGAFRVLPGSHRFGRLSSERILELRGGQTEFLCVASAGDALLMRPLLLHASGRSASGRHRRVLHLEFACFELPGGLEWGRSV